MAKVSLSKKSGTNSRGGISKTGGSKSNLKANDAKYSTTNRQGVTSYYGSSKDVDNGKGPSKQVDRSGKVISATSLGEPQKPMDVPLPPVPQDPGNIVGANNTGLASIMDGYSLDSKGQFSYTAPKETAQPQQQPSSFRDIFNQYMGMQSAPPDTADIYARERRRSGVDEAQQEVNNRTAQLNSITANSQAEQLKLEGQGRGQTEGFIGGEQARINREAAIAALPIQAQLAAAQGNLEMAQQNLNTMFTLKSQDAIAKYNYKQKVIDTVFQFANQEQQRRLDAIKLQEDRAYQTETRNLGLANQWAMAALEYGQSGLAGRIMALDSKSPTYQQDLATLQGQVRKPVAAVAPKAPTLQNFGTSDAPQWKQYNPSTGSWENVAGLDAAKAGGGVLALAQTKGNIDLISGITSDKNLKSAVGPNPFARASFTNLITGGKSNAISTIEQLRSQLTLDSLINAKAKGATFGALSEGELKVLSQSASQLGTWAIKDSQGNVKGYKTTESSFKKEMDKISNFARLDYLLKGGSPADIGVQVQADGTYWVRNSDGSYTELK